MGYSKNGTRSCWSRRWRLDRQVPAAAARQVEGADRPGGPGARPLRRPGDQHRGTRSDQGPQRCPARDPGNVVRQGFSRGRDPDPAADPRRRQRPAVPHPHQRLRPRPVSAHRARAVPQAAVRRRRRAGIRAGPGVPQRGRRLQPQPGVHPAGGLPGARRLQRVDRRLPRADPERGAGRQRRAACSCAPATDGIARAGRHLRAVGGQDRARRGVRGARRTDRRPRPTWRRCAGCATRPASPT